MNIKTTTKIDKIIHIIYDFVVDIEKRELYNYGKPISQKNYCFCLTASTQAKENEKK